MGNISKNFSFSEFTKSDVAKRFHINNEIIDWSVRDNIIALVQKVLQPLRDAYGEPLFINSGFRSKELNAHPMVGGVATSQHCFGQAADVSCSEPLALAKLAKRLRLPFDQMIVYPTFIHFSHRRECDGENRGQILYSAGYKGTRDV